MSLPVLVVCGSSREDSHLRQLCEIASRTATAAGADVRLLDLKDLQLPVMVHEDEAQQVLDTVREVRTLAGWARAFVLGTPEYHGTMSGALKNWFDFLYPELAGKLAGVVASTGGGNGDMSITSVKTCMQWCHGFTLPFHAAASSADFEGGRLVNTRVVDRVERIAHDVVRYGKLLADEFDAAQSRGPSVEAGFAGLHGPR